MSKGFFTLAGRVACVCGGGGATHHWTRTNALATATMIIISNDRESADAGCARVPEGETKEGRWFRRGLGGAASARAADAAHACRRWAAPVASGRRLRAPGRSSRQPRGSGGLTPARDARGAPTATPRAHPRTGRCRGSRGADLPYGVLPGFAPSSRSAMSVLARLREELAELPARPHHSVPTSVQRSPPCT